MIGGGLQLQLTREKELANVLELDEALWAMTGVDVDFLRFERRFLDFVDSDHDGKIRTGEIKEAIRFTLEHFQNLSGIIAGKKTLEIAEISPSAPDAEQIIACAKLLLSNLGRSENEGLTADDIQNSKSFTSFADRNGDGVISCDSGFAPELDALINAIIASGRKTVDLNGKEGISLANVEDFEAALANRLALDDTVKNDPSIMVYGEKTVELYQMFKECEPLIDGYFLNSAAGSFLFSDPERMVKKEFSADLMVPENVRKALENAALAAPGNQDELDFSVPLNPLYREQLLKLVESEALRGYVKGNILPKNAYLQAKAALAPYGNYAANIAASDGLEKFTISELRSFTTEAFTQLKTLIAEDLSFAQVINAGNTLLKMALFQQNLLELLNNFVALPDLFNPKHQSRLQMGKLVMDGRHFTLAVKVKDPATHKRIIKSSNICVLYVEISRRDGAVTESQQLAVAVTSGTMRSLFIGKRGVFFDTDGVIYDAEIKDISEQPVSIGEAFKTPFYSFADFIARQTEKIFNTRNAEMQKNITGELNKSQLAAKPQAPKPAAAPQTQQNNLSALLMGGGIGIAALGSSVAFIAKSLQNVSFTTVLAVLAGIVVIFGGPSVVIALIRIFHRNLSRFLESCGCAVNRPMRMNRKMGSIFTFAPKRPAGEITIIDPVDIFNPVRKKSRLWIWILVILLIILGTSAAVLWKNGYFSKKSAVAPKTVRTTVPQQPHSPAAVAEKTATKVKPATAEKL